MKSLMQLSLAILITSLAASCGPTAHIEQDPSVNLASYKTFAWVDSRTSADDKGTSPTEFAKLSVQNAVNQRLQNAGWTLASSNPDVLLAYDILVERTEEQRNDPIYTRPFTRVYYNPFFNRWGTIYFPSRFIGYDTYTTPVREATLTISMMDAKTDKKIWQGWTRQRVDSRLLSPEEIQSGVASIFKKFRPGSDRSLAHRQ
ncbi:MAG TPA: DUF4136 domain-containing protein [Chitinophagaceae bacterium]|nr:DUF4136 domain-containing protein [Chitinophagaceae bacterium]